MSNISEVVSSLKTQWSLPKQVVHRGEPCPFLLGCSFAAQPVDPGELHQLGLSLPEDVREFWLIARNAELFKDQRYSQWGVEVLEPAQAKFETERQRAARPKDLTRLDLVLARFFGDSDLVVVNCGSHDEGFGSITIALPIDRRSDWPLVATSFGEFLESMAEAQGDKYWETK